MKKLLATIVLGFTASAAFAGPSDQWFQLRQAAQVREQAAVRSGGEQAPYALTGRETGQTVVEWRDISRGRGETVRVPFLVQQGQ